MTTGADMYHGPPSCLLGLFDDAAGGLVAWSEFDAGPSEGASRSADSPAKI
jgi:hypothetical protein